MFTTPINTSKYVAPYYNQVKEVISLFSYQDTLIILKP